MLHVSGSGNSIAGQKRRLSPSNEEPRTKRSQSGMLLYRVHVTVYLYT